MPRSFRCAGRGSILRRKQAGEAGRRLRSFAATCPRPRRASSSALRVPAPAFPRRSRRGRTCRRSRRGAQRRETCPRCRLSWRRARRCRLRVLPRPACISYRLREVAPAPPRPGVLQARRSPARICNDGTSRRPAFPGRAREMKRRGHSPCGRTVAHIRDLGCVCHAPAVFSW